MIFYLKEIVKLLSEIFVLEEIFGDAKIDQI